MTPRGATIPEVKASLESQGIDTSRLSPIGLRPPLGDYLRQIWGRRHFIWLDSRQRVLTQNRRNLLGNSWLVLRPVLDALFFFLIFGVVLRTTGGLPNYTAFIVIGVLMFSSTSQALSTGPALVTSQRSMIRAFSFPRAAVVVSAHLRMTLQQLPALIVMLLMIALLPPHALPRVTWLLLPVVVVLQVILNLGIMFVLARIGFRFPDAAQLMGFVGRVVMYGSGVIFPIDRYLDHPVVSALVEANPVYQVLEIARDLLISGVIPGVGAWLTLAIWSVGLLVVGLIAFWQKEAGYGGGS